MTEGVRHRKDLNMTSKYAEQKKSSRSRCTKIDIMPNNTRSIALLLISSLLLSNNVINSYVAIVSHINTNLLFQNTRQYTPSNKQNQHTSISLILNSAKDNEQESNTRLEGITLKMAFDTNWNVGPDPTEIPERFTSPSSLDLVHRLRNDSDCVLVGKGTVLHDDCSLTVRRGVTVINQPVRVIIDTQLSLLLDDRQYKVLYDGLPTIIYHSSNTIPSSSFDNVQFVPIYSDQKQILHPNDIIHDLQHRNIHHVMIEGGPITAMTFLKSKLVDRAIIIMAPISFENGVKSNMNNDVLIDAGLTLVSSKESDGDTVYYWVRDGHSWPHNHDGHFSWP